MPKVLFTNQNPINVSFQAAGLVDMTNGQKNYFDFDKYNIESWQKIVNMFSQYGNLRVREGINDLVSVGGQVLGATVYRYGTERKLIGATTDNTNTKLIEINRSTGATTDVSTGITGTAPCDFADLRGFLYMANNQTTIKVYDGADNSTTTLTPGTGNIKLVANDEKRIWTVETTDNGDIVRFSESEFGKVTGFDPAGTSLSRGGIAQTNIVDVKAIEGNERTVLIAGSNNIELHQIPALESLGSFPQDIGTMTAQLKNVGITNKNAVKAIGDLFYCMCSDGVLRIISKNGSVKNKFDIKRLFEFYTLEDCAIGYDQKNNNVLIAVKKTGNNDTCIVYNEIDESFSEFSNVFANEFDFDEENLYCYDSNGKFYDCFRKDALTDEGAEIKITMRSSALYLSSSQIEKFLLQYGIQAKYKGNPELKIKIYTDKAEFSQFPAFNESLGLVSTINQFNPVPQPFGLGLWGGAMINLDAGELENEVYEGVRNVGVYGNRFEIEFESSVANIFEFKAFNLYYQTTAKQVYNVEYS